MAVIWSAAAQADVVRIARYIAEENPIAARRVARELLLTGDSLAVFPRRGRWGRVPGTHELVVVRPYVIVYDVDDDGEVFILRVWHTARNRED